MSGATPDVGARGLLLSCWSRNVRFPPIADLWRNPHAERMIDFEHVWMPQIISYADLISTGKLEDQWSGRIGTITSVPDPDELFEQVFDDLDAENIWAENRLSSGLSSATTEAIDQFLVALKEIDGDALAVVRSAAWAHIKEAAQSVVTSVC